MVGMTNNARSNRGRTIALPTTTLLSLMIVLPLSFYFGNLAGMYVGNNTVHDCAPVPERTAASPESLRHEIEILVERKVKEELRKKLSLTNSPPKESRFGKAMWKFAKGAVITKKGDFFKTFDFGNPMESNANDDVLILYNDQALPSNESLAERAVYDDGGGIPRSGVNQATANCDYLSVHMAKNRDKTECLAVLGGYESYHVQKWLRVNDRNKIDHRLPLQHVARGVLGQKGSNAYPSPSVDFIKENWKQLKHFFDTYKGVLKDLSMVAKRIAKQNTIVIMTCNFGQSALLVNFACSARAKGFDLSNVLVFATDEETRDLARGLGLEAFYDVRIFGELPKSEAKRYMDKTFGAMMYVKVVTVQLINMLGYNLVFQDVDIVWYRNPVDVFHDTSSPYYDFDLVFQDDGAHTARYAPFSANSGFYFVRYNARTRYLFTALLYTSEMILMKKSHQQALTMVLAEHSSLFGTKVKVIPLDDNDFPGGWHYHRKSKRDLMMGITQEKIIPRLFHMSWTSNKDNKLLFMKQMGMWYLKEQCVNKRVAEVTKENEDFAGNCCLKIANITCYYRDKPSKIPCKESPPIDKGKPSYW